MAEIIKGKVNMLDEIGSNLDGSSVEVEVMDRGIDDEGKRRVLVTVGDSVNTLHINVGFGCFVNLIATTLYLGIPYGVTRLVTNSEPLALLAGAIGVTVGNYYWAKERNAMAAALFVLIDRDKNLQK